AIAMAGMPPLSGFLGKLLVLDAVRGATDAWLIWTVVLTTSLVAIVGFAQAGSMVFWNTTPAQQGAAPYYAPLAHPAPALPLVASIALLAGVALLSVLAGPITGYLEQTAAQLFAPQDYIDAVMRTPQGEV
ncbi:MAG TPA: monovalent cation/H+ antiporter subunit D, partial [Paracoccaceae bacterium]|nr:monovalent cation/H+ antiporter subunit D [Paracoccaceae bacterium]